MSSFYSDASLVLIPSGYKNQKVYSAVPTDGSGDLSFTRASSATRVASNGLIEKVRTNSILQSNTFSNASWTKAGVGVGSVSVVTPNYTTDPFGGNNAWRFQCNLNGGTTSSDRSWMLQSFTSFADSVLSIYIKLNVAGSKTIILSNGAGDVKTITSTDWVRISIVTAASSGEFRIGLIGGSTSDTLDCSIAFAQAETGDIATDYIATTTAAVSVGPVSGLPRLDYLGSTCPRLLLEPQRSNLALYSEQLNNAYWTQNATVTANSTISPSGYQDADTLTDSTGAFLDVRRSFTITASTAYTFSIFVKKTTGALTNYAGVGFSAGGGIETGYAIFNTTTGAVNLTGVAGGFVLSAKSTSYGDYYRFEMTFTSGQTSLIVLIYPALSQNGTTLSFDAQGSNVFWGCQLETGAYATSYIPTLGASVTRVADAASKSSISSLIGQTEGTLFLEFSLTGLAPSNARINLSDETNANWVFISAESSKLRGFVRANAVTIFSDETISPTSNNKVAVAYKSGSLALYINGVQILTSASTFTFSSPLTQFGTNLGASNQISDAIVVNQSLIFKTRLTNAQLAELTAL